MCSVGAMTDDTSAIAANVKRLRQRAGMSQAALAEAMRAEGAEHWHQNTVSRIEQGSRTLVMRDLRALLRVLGPEVTRGTDMEEGAARLNRRALELVSIPRLRAAEAKFESGLRDVRAVLYAMGENVPYDEEDSGADQDG